MRMNAIPVIEVTAFPEAPDGYPLIPYGWDGGDPGYSLAVDVLEIQYAPKRPACDEMVMLSGRARGLRVGSNAGELAYSDTKLHWIDLNTEDIPASIAGIVEAMTARALAEWQKITGGKLCSCSP